MAYVMETVLDQAKQRNAAKRKLAVQPCAFAATLAVRPTLLKVAEDALNLLQRGPAPSRSSGNALLFREFATFVTRKIDRNVGPCRTLR